MTTEINKKLAFYPGCSSHGIGQEYGIATKKVVEQFQELPDVEDWNCCGATQSGTFFSNVDHDVFLGLNMRNLALAEKQNSDVLVSCNACYSRLMLAKFELTDTKTRREIAKGIHPDDPEYLGTSEVIHLVEYFHSILGKEKLTEKVTNLLKGLKVVPYYGCMLTRPREINKYSDAEFPTEMDDILTWVGANVLEFPSKTSCCGNVYVATAPGVTKPLITDIFQDAEDAGAEVVSTICPSCHFNLESMIGKVRNRDGKKFNLSVVYLPQLIGISMGMSKKDVALHKNLTKQGWVKRFS